MRALIAVALLLAGCDPASPDRVVAKRYDAFWLWAGVAPQPVLKQAKTLYILEGEIRRALPVRHVSLRPESPRLPGQALWMVVRVETLDWPPALRDVLGRRLDQWRRAGNTVTGLQIDFDADTRHLDRYAAFLTEVRRRLPPRYRLSVTGLLDWGANADPRALSQLAPVVDEVVLQTYRGPATVPDVEAYLARLDRVRVPFRLGLVQGGTWRGAPQAERNAFFRGYVVFLVNPKA